MTTTGAVLGLFSMLAAAPPAPTTSWSDDGAAEAQALRDRAKAKDKAEIEQAMGTRGLVFEARVLPTTEPGPAVGPAVTPGTDVPPPMFDQPIAVDDLRRQADIERIIRRGRRLFIPGVVLSTLGTIIVVGAIAGISKEANAVTGGLLGGSLAVSAIGWPMLVIGVKMRKHPEKYLDRRATASLSPLGLVAHF